MIHFWKSLCHDRNLAPNLREPLKRIDFCHARRKKLAIAMAWHVFTRTMKKCDGHDDCEVKNCVSVEDYKIIKHFFVSKFVLPPFPGSGSFIGLRFSIFISFFFFFLGWRRYRMRCSALWQFSYSLIPPVPGNFSYYNGNDLCNIFIIRNVGSMNCALWRRRKKKSFIWDHFKRSFEGTIVNPTLHWIKSALLDSWSWSIQTTSVPSRCCTRVE